MTPRAASPFLICYGSTYIAADLADWLEKRKIERWHQTLKNRILLENHYLPSDLTLQIEAFVEYYNRRR